MGFYPRQLAVIETTDLTVTDDLIVGDDAAITGLLTVGETLAVTGVASLPGNVAMTPGTGISTGSGTLHQASVVRIGNRIETTIDIDLSGLNSSAAGDIIGVNTAANSHFGRVLEAVNGVIFAGSMTCLETPTTGEPDIDVYTSTAATGAEDAPIGSEAGQAAMLDAAADWTIGTTKMFTAMPAANAYLYLVGSGGGTSATYNAGKFQIKLYGHVAA